MKKIKTEAKEVKEVNPREALRQLLKAKTPAIFEREPAPAFAEGYLNALVEEILKLK